MIHPIDACPPSAMGGRRTDVAAAALFYDDHADALSLAIRGLALANGNAIDSGDSVRAVLAGMIALRLVDAGFEDAPTAHDVAAMTGSVLELLAAAEHEGGSVEAAITRLIPDAAPATH